LRGFEEGRVEGWKSGRVDEWKIGRLENWKKNCRMGDLEIGNVRLG